MFFFNFPDFQIIGSSPEILVRLRKNKITIRPIAGTRPRGTNIKKDQILKVFKKINHSLDILNTIDIIGIDISIKILENLKSEYNYYMPEILYQCKLKKILGKKNKTSIKSIFESSNYPNQK